MILYVSYLVIENLSATMKDNMKIILCFLFVTLTAGACPNGWINFESSCYFFGGKMLLTYHEAQAFCGTIGGHVININGPAENTFAKSYARRGDNHMWIGGTREIDHVTWLWYPSLAPMNFTDWGSSAEGSTANEHCAFLYKPDNYEWHDVPCRNWSSGRFLLLCEKQMGFKDPSCKMDGIATAGLKSIQFTFQ